MTVEATGWLYISHYTTCLAIRNLAIVWFVHYMTEQQGVTWPVIRYFTSRNLQWVCLVSELHFVMKTHMRSDTGNDVISCKRRFYSQKDVCKKPVENRRRRREECGWENGLGYVSSRDWSFFRQTSTRYGCSCQSLTKVSSMLCVQTDCVTGLACWYCTTPLPFFSSPCTLIDCSSSLHSLPVTTLFTQQDLDGSRYLAF